ncbi:MAG: glycosyltransferase [Bacteroidetes bacterium]|nr:glycosyltransferase [Bacteroidota bacterium]
MQKIAIVVPCFNEAKRINRLAFQRFLEEHENSFFFLFVNDGSVDSTESVLQEICKTRPQNSQFLSLEKNKGKGEAVRLGMVKCYEMNQFIYIGYFDADLATPLSELSRLKEIAFRNPNLLLIFCSRIKRLGAKINRKPHRLLLGRIFASLASLILKFPIHDTQCGAKIMKSDIVPFVCGDGFLTSWLFDTEILLRLRNQQKEQTTSVLYEHSVSQWEEIQGSNLKLIHLLQIPLQLLKIHFKYNFN